MIKVLHILNAMNAGGIETFIMNVYRKLDYEKIQFDFLLGEKTNSAYEKEIISYGGKIYYVPNRRKGVIKNKLAIHSFFKEHHDYNAVHMHVSCLSYIGPLVAAKKNGIPIRIIHAHSSVAPGNKIHLLLHYINKIIVSKIANYYFACSDNSLLWLYSGTKSFKKAIIIPNGIDCNEYYYNESTRNKYRKDLKIDNRIVLVHVGRFSTEKNHSFLIDIFSEYVKRKSNAVLLMVGDGELINAIKEKVKKLNINNNVMFLGFRKDISEIFQASDVNLLPSLYEGFPVSMLEAQATGLPCVFAETITKSISILSNTRRVSINNGVGIWIRAIEEVLNMPRIQEANQIVKQAGYDIKEVVNELEKYYSIEKVLSN